MTWVNGGGLILVYHRIADAECDPWGLCVSPANFAEHLQVLRKYGPCMTVGEIVRKLEVGELPRRAIAVSFDDGYADNLHAAKPLLEHFNVPATFFLSAGLLDGISEFWWDELERILLHPGTLPQELKLTIAGQLFQAQLRTGITLSSNDCLRYRVWRYTERPPTDRHALYLKLWSTLRSLSHEVRANVLEQLTVWAGSVSEPRRSHRPLSTDEAVKLGRGDLIEIGAHTLTHPLLATLPAGKQRSEIFESKKACEALWGRRVDCFSYPHGESQPMTVELVRAAGFTCACGGVGGRLGKGTNRYQLPRIPAGNWKGPLLMRKLVGVHS